MKTFKEFILEAKDEATSIRDILKKKYGLSSRDVSVKSQYAGHSSSINIKIKTEKALQLKSKIEDIASELEVYDRDSGSGEILMGGNTFVFVDIDSNFEDKLTDTIQKEFDKEKGDWNEGDRVILYGTFEIHNIKGTTFVRVKGKSGSVEVRNIKYVGSGVLSMIRTAKDDTLYTKIK